MVDSNCCEHLGRAFRLIGFDPHFVTGDFLVILLAEDGDDVERRAPGQTGGHQFDWLRSSASSCIVQQLVMAASGLGHKLALLLKWLSQFDFGCDHDCLLLFVSPSTRINARGRILLQEKFDGVAVAGGPCRCLRTA
jgi:hypothetical protein